MSRFGDDNTFQNDLSEMLEQRALEIGNHEAMKEVAKVLAYHFDTVAPCVDEKRAAER